MTPAHLREAVDDLSKTERGRSAMCHLLAWLDDDGLGLDERNQEAYLIVLHLAWNGYAGTTRDLLREAVEPCA
jgi:hypothetical protein